ncbi:hypothetical protein BH10PSE1_BH10PSE1_19040 [soil metagenome]
MSEKALSMSRPRLVLPLPIVDDMSEEETRAIRAELESRLDWIRTIIDSKRLADGMIEIEEGVWVFPDEQTDRALP